MWLSGGGECVFVLYVELALLKGWTVVKKSLKSRKRILREHQRAACVQKEQILANTDVVFLLPCLSTRVFNVHGRNVYTYFSTKNFHRISILNLDSIQLFLVKNFRSLDRLVYLIFVPRLQLPLIKRDFHVLENPKPFHNLDLDNISWNRVERKERISPRARNEPAFGVSIIKAVPSQRQWRC